MVPEFDNTLSPLTRAEDKMHANKFMKRHILMRDKFSNILETFDIKPDTSMESAVFPFATLQLITIFF